MRRLSLPALSASAFLGLALSVASPGQAPSAGGNHCDPDLRSPTNDPYGYKLRGDRCEGIYIRDVAGTTLDIVSLTEFVEDFAPSADRDLLIEWTAPPDVALHLRAQALRPRLYYRMDSDRPANGTAYRWTPNLLRELKLGRAELAFLGSSSRTIGGGARTVYFPLRVSQRKPALRSARYTLVLVPGVECDEVFLTVAPVDQHGRPGASVVEDQALDRGYYPADRPVTIDLPPLKSTGLYQLEIGAKLRTGGSSATRIWLYGGGA